MTQKTCGIYRIVNIKNGKSYIGSSIWIERRWTQHRHILRNNKHRNDYFQRSWNKYGEDSFCFEVLEKVDPVDLIDKENFYIKANNSEYNLNTASPTRLGSKFTEEQRKRLSEAHKGIPNPRKGVKTGKPAWNRGIPRTLEARIKQSNNTRGKNKPNSGSFKKGTIHNLKRLRKIKCLELNMVFDSIAAAARFISNPGGAANINAVCSGKQKTAYGYTWEFINP